MGLQLRCYVDGKQEYIELYGDEKISMEISFAEIQDITKKNSAYTQEFKVPGTNNNNYIFNYFFDINTVYLNWNPKKKFEADLIYNGYEIFNGYVRLNSVNINIKEKIYSVTFYTAVGDIASNIGDKGLCQVDTTSLNHNLYLPGVASSLFLDPSLHPVNVIEEQSPAYAAFLNTYDEGWNGPVGKGEVQYILGQRGYDYTGSTYGTIRDIDTSETPILEFSGKPIAKFGFFDFSGSPLISSYLIPSIRTRNLYELIVNQAGYEIESNFFETDYFGRYYLPLSFNTDQPFMAQAKPYEYSFVNTSGQTNIITTGVTNFSAGTTATRNLLATSDITKENMGFNPVEYSYYSEINYFSSGLTPYLFALPQANGSPFKWEATLNNVWTGAPYGVFPQIYVGGRFDLWQFLSINPSTGIVAKYVGGADYYVFTDYTGHKNDYYISGTTAPLGNLFGTNLYFLTYTKSATPAIAAGTSITGCSFNIISSPIVLPREIKLNEEMACDQKQIDFIQNVNRMFNLAVVEHPIKPKTIIVEPIVNYIGKGETLDWTSKVDFNSLQTLRPTTSIINGSLFLANKEDKDFVNTQYSNKSNNIFGQRFIDLGIDYKNDNINLVQTLGQNTDYYLNASGDTNIALPCYFVSKETSTNGISVFEYRPFRSLPRMTFKSISIPTGNTSQNSIFYRYAGTNKPFTNIGLTAIGTIPNVNRLTTYPYAISGFSHYTIYNSSTKFTSDELVYPEVDTQYDRYYRDYIEDLISPENKIYNCTMYLTPWEVSQLRFDEKILIKNAYFRVNKISNLNLLEPDTCDVELVKLTRDYEPTPTLFYDLISCTDPCVVYHSHTDLSYLLWAFENQFVEIITQFYEDGTYDEARVKVVRTDYNPNYTYEQIYFNTSFTNTFDYNIQFDFATFDSCESIEPNNKLKVYNDFTGSSFTDCYTFNITNTADTRATFTFVNCSGTTSSWTLDPAESITTCGQYQTFDTTGFTYCITSFSGCTGSTPLPTPTPTLTPNLSPTPTPSITPSSMTPTPTMTPSSTRALNCKINTQLNITDIGYIKYTVCDTEYTEYIYVSNLGSYTITDCIVEGTVSPGYPLADVASFTITSSGTSC